MVHRSNSAGPIVAEWCFYPGSPFHLRQDRQNRHPPGLGPNQTAKWGQIKASNSHSDADANSYSNSSYTDTDT
jgi:hypothetical protein